MMSKMFFVAALILQVVSSQLLYQPYVYPGLVVPTYPVWGSDKGPAAAEGGSSASSGLLHNIPNPLSEEPAPPALPGAAGLPPMPSPRPVSMAEFPALGVTTAASHPATHQQQ